MKKSFKLKHKNSAFPFKTTKSSPLNFGIYSGGMDILSMSKKEKSADQYFSNAKPPVRGISELDKDQF